MRANKCDRCGALYEDKFEDYTKENLELYRYNITKCCHPYEDTTLDLCKQCRKNLFKWLKNGGRE